ncbi:MAG TPA: PHB depolymerase family esterase [Fimbriimonas sp.]|nr:PHB depolymerase family esterase [Fimbriimonas sp.]
MNRSLLVGIAGLASLAHAAEIRSEFATTKDGKRPYLLALPEKTTQQQRPLVILLHGHSGSAGQILGERSGASPLSEWLRIADREGVVVAALDGAKGPDGFQGWNDGRVDAPGNPKSDDLAFIRGVIDHAVSSLRVDPRRVYLMGMSNGGMMTFRAAVELDRPIAAFAAVSSSMPPKLLREKPRHPVAALIVAGTADPLVPFYGGQVHFGLRKRGAVVSIPDSVAYWRKVDHAPPNPATRDFPHLERRDPTSASQIDYGSSVRLIEIQGGGHVEPSIEQRFGRLYLRIVGKQNHDLESAEEAWKFFSGQKALP